MADALGPLDALFLHMEDGISHMHIGSCSIFEGPPPPIQELTRMIESKLTLLPRYRQRVRFVPAGLGHPVWTDDPHFNISFHVRHSALPPSGGADALDRLMGRVMSQELDRHRPLWEMWMIEGLPGGTWAMIAKVHHCMVDGVAGTDLMNLLLDQDRSATPARSEPWVAAAAPSSARLVVDATRRLLTAPLRVAPLALGIGDIMSGGRSLVGRALRSEPPLSLEGPIGPHRRWSSVTRALADVTAIRRSFGGSVNDVVLTAIAGALRTVLIQRGEPVDGASMRTLVPVSIRRPDDHRHNNQVSMIIAELPIGVADPVERLSVVRRQMDELKASHQASAGAGALAAVEMVPPVLLALGVSAATALLRRRPQRFINTVTTNVPGPKQPLFALGREMLEYRPFVPLSQGLRTGVAILSYNGQLAFGVTGDYDATPDVAFIAEQIGEQLDVLHTRAVRRDRKTAPRRHLQEVS